MEKEQGIFIGIVAVIVAVTLGLFYMNGMILPGSLQTGGQAVGSNLTFTAQVVSDENYLTFRYIPAVIMTGPVTATYQVQKDGKVLFSDKKIFDSVTPDNPIEIAMKRSDNGTYTMIMLISGKGKNLLHHSTTSWYGSNATSSTNPAASGVVSTA
ncbi:MAG: hypothetical protein WCJ93_05150 [Methanomicrobiales archaeon]